MAKYLVLIYGDEHQWATETAEQQQEKDAGHERFVATAGHAVRGGHQLAASSAARTMRTVGGRVKVTDGPFPETKEVIGGFYLLEAPDTEAAVALARELPEVAVAHCAVEVRPIVENL